MKPAERAYFAGCAALIGFALLYALPVYARLPRTFYDPVARSWHWTRGMGPIPMGYMGQVVWGIGGALLFAGAAGLITRRMKQTPSERAFGLWAAWALTALSIVIGYFTWNNWP